MKSGPFLRFFPSLFRTAPFPHFPAGCDTFVATGETTLDGVTLFGKNSDREPNEAHVIFTNPAADYKKNSTVKCTYIEIPQVEHTFANLLAKPCWIWGAEMGVNEKGLAIGNEAVFTKAPYDKKPGLIGMDYVRLALERADSAVEAVKVIVDLLETHGQSGNCGFEHKLYYHNSFLLADPKEAWVLETAGQHWAAKKVSGLYSISNGITIDNEWDKASVDLVDFAIAKKWCKNASDFSFSKCYSDFLYTTFSDCRKRRNRTMQLLTSRSGEISLNTMMTVLRDHGDEENYTPDRGLTGAGVCMHAGCGPVRVSQTTGSLVCHLHPESPTIFYTGTAAPCTSLYKPVWIDATLPAAASTARGSYEADSLFWKHEVLHRHMLEDYSTLIHTIQHERDTLEQEFIQKALAMALFSSEERSGFSAASYARAESMESAWLKNILSLQKHRSQKWLHKLAWQHFSKKAKMPH